MLGSRLKLVCIFVLTPSFVLGESLTYNSSWGFRSPNELSVNISRLDLEERKAGGFYNSFKSETNYEGNSFVTYDCTGSSALNRANESVTSVSAQTSSPSTGSQLELDSIATGNDQQSGVFDGGDIAADQEASGTVTSNTDLILTNETGVINAGGGTSTQDSDTSQSNSGNLSASAETGVGCNFYREAIDTNAQVSE